MVGEAKRHGAPVSLGSFADLSLPERYLVGSYCESLLTVTLVLK